MTAEIADVSNRTFTHTTYHTVDSRNAHTTSTKSLQLVPAKLQLARTGASIRETSLQAP